MHGRILVPTNLTDESNAVFPLAVTIAQAFPDKFYMLHVMDPESVNRPERLEDFPGISDFFKRDRDKHFEPPLKATVPIAKMYVYNRDVAKVILGAAKQKDIDLICMSAIRAGANFAWWSAGKTIETVLEKSPCSVLCIRGRNLKEKDWQRPQIRHVLLVSEIDSKKGIPLEKVMPWIDRFQSMLHIFPLGDITKNGDTVRDLCHTPDLKTNVLLFAKPRQRMENLLRFIDDTPIDLLMMTPQTRSRFSNRLFNDVFVSLLRLTDVPVLILR